MAVLATAGAATAICGGAAAARDPAVPSHCTTQERVLYSCAFPRGIGSLCATSGNVHYRFGPRGQPNIDLASLADWSNVHLGEVRGQGSGYQRHIRISRGLFHYVVYEGMDGYLADHPGHRYSGISVLEGERGEHETATLYCPGRAVFALSDPLLSSQAKGEDTDGNFDMWY